MSLIQVDDPKDWHALRQQHVGGSEVSALFNRQPPYAMSRWTLWQVKSGRMAPPEVNGDRPAWGLRLEQTIAEGAAEAEGWNIARGGYAKSEKVEGLGATLDYLIEEDPRYEGPGLLECKNVDWLIHKRTWDGEPPEHVLLQLQHQLAATGFKWGCVAGLVGGNKLEVYPYEARPKIIGAIEEGVAEFWDSVKAKAEPPVDDTVSTQKALQTLYAESDGKDLDVSDDHEFAERLAQLAQARFDKTACEAKERAAANWLLHRIGAAELVKSDDMVVLTAKTVKRKGYEVKPTSYRTLKLQDYV